VVEALTKPSYDVSDSEPFFLDDKRIAYFHHHTDSDVDQLYVLDLADRDAPYQLTDFPIDFGNVKYNAKQQLLAFSAAVYPDKNTLEGTLEKDKYIKENKKDTALVYDELMVRHWDDFVHEKKNNIFVVNLSIDDKKYKVANKPINLLKDTGLVSEMQKLH
jgi:acylaminoacyl-peptidase